MTRGLLILATACLASVAPVFGQLREPPGAPEARRILNDVILALPDVPLRVTGDLIARARGGAPDMRKGVEMLLDWHADPPSARYTLRDAFGGPLSHLAITWDQPRAPVYRYFEGYPLRAAPAPDLVGPIPGTDISWMDLSLSFLWWPGARTVGREDVRGQTCWVIDIPAPDAFAGCAGVRLWISPRINILLKAEAYDAGNEPMRRLDVKSFKRINNRWVIKDIELTSLPARTRTLLRVRTVEDRTRTTLARADGDSREMEDRAEHAVDEGAMDDIDPVTPTAVEIDPMEPTATSSEN